MCKELFLLLFFSVRLRMLKDHPRSISGVRPGSREEEEVIKARRVYVRLCRLPAGERVCSAFGGDVLCKVAAARSNQLP